MLDTTSYKVKIFRGLMIIFIFVVKTSVCQVTNLTIEDYNHADSAIFPVGIVQPIFKKIGDDSLRLFKEIKKFTNSNDTIGKISCIETDDNNIYLADYKLDKIFVLDKKTLNYKHTIGNGPSNEPSHINGPTGLLIFNKNIFVQQYKGQYLFSSFTPDGKYIKSIKRNSKNYSPDPLNSFLKDSTVYISQLVAKDLNKLEVINLMNPAVHPLKNMLPVSDFHAKKDSATMSTMIVISLEKIPVI